MLLLEQSATIQRNQAVGTNGRNQLGTVATGVSCLALPMGAQATITMGFSIGQAYDIYFDISSDVRIGDKVVIGSDSFMVKGVSTFATTNNPHRQAMCVRENV